MSRKMKPAGTGASASASWKRRRMRPIADADRLIVLTLDPRVAAIGVALKHAREARAQCRRFLVPARHAPLEDDVSLRATQGPQLALHGTATHVGIIAADRSLIALQIVPGEQSRHIAT
jgi:hypothetical protein